ncbi:benzoate 1,2-dioxygenase electron transfer component BenC [Arthrobacter sp. SDTb3-6]|uniref:benzoate 1,2-dioxygenase electron transfer component BenC n=1 Tax=Arthrobacter sp. SDTb3-6 TaxID=2713571 RepID=UPI00159D27CF|nr:benzoate 1,2-dioxygenase electron transfer component BenC [Arthrobacter sp. SDTb3-6]NVM97295.1 FCD domain-containing protein [Arthrobacter sp. SDTb3-6]
MTYQVALAFEDGITRFIKVGPRETVADASYKARINIPLDCRDGACGTCKSFCESGKFDGGDYIDEALTEDEAEAGYCLPCQMVPESDLVLQIPTTSDVAKTAATTYSSTLTEIRRISETTYAFSLHVENRGDLNFLPGQYVNIEVPGSGGQTRSYSFSSGPEVETVSFLIRITDGGLMSTYMRDVAQVGDAINFTGPMGSFFLREPKRTSLLLAGGTGLAPLLAILEKLSGMSNPHPVHLIYGVNTDTDLVEIDVLEDYRARIEGFTFDTVVGDPASSAEKKGYVTNHFQPHHLADGDVDIYLCGPPPMVEGVRRHLEGEGIKPQNFYFEKFALAVVPDAAPAPQAPAAAAPAAEAAEPPSTLPAYEIGEEHATFQAQFDARMALELAIVELTMGKLTPEQLVEFKVLAQLAGKTLDGEKFVNAEEFTVTNEAFHQFLFSCVGNEHLLQAYNRLEVPATMAKVLRQEHWIDGAVDADHLQIVAAFENNDLAGARKAIMAHNEHAKATMAAASKAGAK